MYRYVMDKDSQGVALTISTLMKGDGKEVVLIRRTIVRYVVLSQILVFRDISMKVRRRFPNLESLVTAGFLHEGEKNDLEKINIVYNKYWAPINWALTLCYRAHKDGHLSAPPSLNTCINEIKTFRTNLALLCNFDWVPVPIAYPQVVFLAVRVYFLICMVSRQYILGDTAPNKSVVAEALLNPLGEDDDDFECNFLIDKNIATGLSIVDETYDYAPELLPDRFMDPNYEPVYSEESQKHGHDNILVGSAEGIKLADSNENVKMVAVNLRASQNDLRENISEPRSRTTAAMKRKFTDALRLRLPVRSQSVQPVRLGVTKPVVVDTNPERPYTAFDLSNGFAPSTAFFADKKLSKVEEELDGQPSDKKLIPSYSMKSTVESIDETDVRCSP
ncbi:hypothetical protein RB195_003008 [Necator americanus]|uniref:Bestrophin homolog n=1 Tax=Necator americanus TaxID=51031 RepID=A0ABR1DMB1_NECAM